MRRWCVFNAVATLGFAVQLAILAGLVRLGFHYLPSTVVAVEAAVIHNFLWHRRWTWSDRTQPYAWQSRFWRFQLLNGAVSVLGNLVVMTILVDGGHVPLVAANALAVSICGLVNFMLSDRLVFLR